jgi:multiple sugar transport system substrate-binding protein
MSTSLRMRKVWAILLILCLLLSGCGGGSQGKVSFMVFGDPAELAAYQKLVAAFEAKYPQVQVELRHVASQGDYQQQLVTAFSAGAEPDVMLLNYRRVLQFAARGGLEPVGAYLEQSQTLHTADLYPQALEAFQWDERQWCVPQNISSLVVYYNRGLFDDAGLPYPSEGWSWDDFLQTARFLTLDLDGDGLTDQYGAGVSPELFRLAPFIWQNGGELVDGIPSPSQGEGQGEGTAPTRLTLDSPAALEAFQWFVDLQVRQHVVPDAAAEQAESSENRFMNGRLAMFFNSRRGVPSYRTLAGLDWDVASLPSVIASETKQSPSSSETASQARSDIASLVQAVGILHSDGYCMAARAKDKDSAWKLIEFANSVEGQTLMAGTGRTVPSLMQVAESPAFLDPTQLPASSRVFLDAIPLLRRVPLLPEWPRIEEMASREIERAFYGQATVLEAAQSAIDSTIPYFNNQQP